MNKQTTILCILTLALVMMSPLRSNQPHAQTISGLQQQPLDTLEAERVRIWVGIERSNRCRLRVDILNDSNVVLRHLVDYLAPKGYYNFYWDKRDDSGMTVPKGVYRYRIDDCRKISFGTVEAQYTFWEENSSISQPDSSRTFAFELELKADSALVSMIICNGRGMEFDKFFIDSLMNKGRHLLEWTPSNIPYRGNYLIKMIVGDYEYRKEVTYIP